MKKDDALKYFGGVSNTAKALGIHRSSVSLWGDEIPMGRAYQIEILTKGQLKARPESNQSAAAQ